MMLLLYSSLVALYMLNVFVQSQELNYIVGILAILSLMFSFKAAKGLYKISGFLFLVIGAALYPFIERPLHHVPFLMTSTVIIVTIILVLPFINSIIIVGRYDQSVNRLLKAKTNHLGQLYYRGSFVSFLLGSFLNIGTLPLVHHVLEKNLKEKTKRLRSVFISRSMLRGYALCLVWSPMEVLVALSIDMTGVNYLTVLPWLLLVSFLLLLADWGIGWRYKRYALDAYPEQNGQSHSIDRKVVMKIIALAIYLVVFITTIILVKRLVELSFLEAVAFLIIPYSILWASTIKRLRSYAAYSVETWKKRTANLQNFMVLFLSVGFFISVLRESGYMDVLQRPFMALADWPVLLFVSVQVIFLALAMVGFHPLVTLSLLGEVIYPVLTAISPLSMAVVLITSSLATVMAGPFNISVSITGVLLEENPYRISIWNIAFAFLFGGAGTIVALFLL